MKNLILLFGAGIILITATSCDKTDDLFAPTETKLLGEWRIEKVVFCPTLSINQFNITNQYSDLIFTFSEGNNLVRSNITTGDTANGSFRIETDVEYNGDESYQNTEILSGALVDFTNQQVTTLYWRDLYVTRKKITANEQRDGGNYRYTLVKN